MSSLKLSIIVICHNMRREATRTLLSLSAAYQTGVSDTDYEVIAIDNGSSQPLDPGTVTAYGPNFQYHYFETSSVSPVEAMNHGATYAQGQALAFIVDGARMASPGLVGRTLQALALADDPLIVALCWHLGPKIQNLSMLDGYNQAVEDDLLDSITWPKDGYRLFDISTIAASSKCGFLGGIPPECSWICLPKTSFETLGGYDTRFQTEGGGLVNHEFRNRALLRPTVAPIALLGEGLFHQFHGGVATNVPKKDHPHGRFEDEYAAIIGQPYHPGPCPEVTYLGAMPTNTYTFLTKTS